jgi:UDP-glucose 4-epimerase
MPHTEHVKTVRVRTYTEIPPPFTTDDVLIHLAQPNRTPTLQESRDAVDVVQHIAQLGYRHLVYASSARVYGDQVRRPRQPDEPLTSAGLYEEMKLAAEAVISQAGGTSARLSNLYGIGQSSATVVGRVLDQIPGSGDNLKVWSTAPVRDFCWIEDAADALLVLARAGLSDIFNVGTGIGTSIGALARLALEAAGEEGRTIWEEAPNDDSSVLILDIEETSRRTGWKPQTNVQAGLKQLIRARRTDGLTASAGNEAI